VSLLNFAVAPLGLDARPRVRLIGLGLLGRRAGGEKGQRIGGDGRAEGERHRHRVRVEGPEAAAWQEQAAAVDAGPCRQGGCVEVLMFPVRK